MIHSICLSKHIVLDFVKVYMAQDSLLNLLRLLLSQWSFHSFFIFCGLDVTKSQAAYFLTVLTVTEMKT